jgi:hypothetical protein
MRDSNYKSITNNRAAVTITTSLYDRRALDVTSDKPLVNSLNHLTYLVLSSAKVRETLAVDGGIERLIEILRECHNLTFNLADNIFNSERKLLTAWKWTLTFQCLVLIGTRGTEKVRQRVVKAGMLPIIATVLDNYLTIHERSFVFANGQYQPYQPQQQPYQPQQQPYQPQQQPYQPQQQPYQPQQQPYQPQQQPPQSQPPQPQSQPQQPQHQYQQSPLPHPQHRVHMLDQALGRAEAPASPARVTERVVPQDAPSTLVPLMPPAGQRPPFAQGQRVQHAPLPQQPQRQPQGTFEPFVPHISIPELDPSINASAAHSVYPADATSVYRVPGGAGLQPSASFCATQAQNLTSDDYENLSVEQLFRLTKMSTEPHLDSRGEGTHDPNSISNDIRRRYFIINIIQKLRKEKENDALECSYYNECDYDMDCDLEFLTDMYLQEEQRSPLSNYVDPKIAPRNFTDTGVVIPRDDDIVWSLQLLAYISKYPYLKDMLQNTHLVIDMSIRDKQVKLYLEKQLKTRLKKTFLIDSRPKAKPKSRKHIKVDHNDHKEDTCVERFRLSASNSPQMMNDMSDLAEEQFVLNGFVKHADIVGARDDEVGEASADNADDTITAAKPLNSYEDEDLDEQSSDSLLLAGDEDDIVVPPTLISDGPKCDLPSSTDLNETVLQKLHSDVIRAELLPNDLERKLALLQVSEVIGRTIEAEKKQLSEAIIMKRVEKSDYLSKRWDYDSYDNFDIDNDNPDEGTDFDDSLVEYKRANLFPMVEKFTFLAGTDMYYWAGVIMRNSCRRNEAKGGVRQCGNIDCGKWERYPREFLKCRKCKRTKYCSRECQMRAWQCHRNWCIPSSSSSGGTAASGASTSSATTVVLAQEPPRVVVAARPPSQ